MDTSGTGLPASFEAAWGLRDRPARGPKPGLGLDRIIEAAVRVADTDGLAAVSMSRVATDLGTSAMSLYRYVGSKDELLELMEDHAYGLPPDLADGHWRDGLTRWAWAEHEALRRRPWIVRIPLTGPPVTPNQLAWLESGLRCLRDTGLGEGEKLSAMLLVTTYVRGEAHLTIQINEGVATAGLDLEQVMSGYGTLLARLTDREHFPALHAVLASGAFAEDDGPDGEFAFGLDRVLDGVEALVRARAHTGRD